MRYQSAPGLLASFFLDKTISEATLEKERQSMNKGHSAVRPRERDEY